MLLDEVIWRDHCVHCFCCYTIQYDISAPCIYGKTLTMLNYCNLLGLLQNQLITEKQGQAVEQ